MALETLVLLRNFFSDLDGPRAQVVIRQSPAALAAAHVWFAGCAILINDERVQPRPAGAYELESAGTNVRFVLHAGWVSHSSIISDPRWFRGLAIDGVIVDCREMRSLESMTINLIIRWQQSLPQEMPLRLENVSLRCADILRQMRLDLILPINVGDPVEPSSNPQ